MTTTLLQTCRLAPASTVAEEHSLPLTCFDIPWMNFHPSRLLLFYEISCSKEYFLDNLVPNLKDSLSVTLKHYFPAAGNFAYPLDTENNCPVIRCAPGDSVPLTIAESNGDFDNLVGNHARDADQFYDFIPQLPLISEQPGSYQLLKVLAVQVTLFPGRGICIGLVYHHVLGDGSSMNGFIQSWAEICKNGGDGESLKTLPVFDRSLMKLPPGINSFYWNMMKQAPLKIPTFQLPTNRVRATFVFGQAEIKKLKDSLLARRPGLVHVSSFVVAMGYLWACLLKAVAASGDDEVVDDDAEEVFVFSVDARARMDPPVPGNYFGNCLAYGMPKTRHGEVSAEEGFFVAAEAIALEIQNKVNVNKKLMADMENWMSDISGAKKKWILTVSGSSRVELYNADFGWGKMRKLELLSIDAEKYAVALCRSRDPTGGLECGLSLPKMVMEAFSKAFLLLE